MNISPFSRPPPPPPPLTAPATLTTMDCEKFDQIIIDALYDELDELTLAAAKRHAEGCPRCQAAWSGLKATLKSGFCRWWKRRRVSSRACCRRRVKRTRNVPWPKRVGRAHLVGRKLRHAAADGDGRDLAAHARLERDLRSGKARPKRGTEPGQRDRARHSRAGRRRAAPRQDSAFEAKAGAVGRSARRDEERGGPASPPPAAVAARETASDNEARGARALDKAAEPFAEAPVRSKGGRPQQRRRPGLAMQKDL